MRQKNYISTLLLLSAWLLATNTLAQDVVPDSLLQPPLPVSVLDSLSTAITEDSLVQSALPVSDLDSLRAQAEAERLADSLLTVARINMLPEVVVYGQYHDIKEKMHLTMSKTELQLLQPHPQGFSPLGLIVWAVDKLWGNKHRHRKEMQRQKHKMILDNY